MKLPNLKLIAKKNNLIIYVVLLFIFFVFLILNREFVFQEFEPQVVNNYLRSQDILDINDEIKNRIFISDADIYIAAGYLYVNGAKPTDYNFQHPPFIKYLFGFSAKYFDLPLLPNIIFAGLLIFEVFLLGKLAFKSETVGILSAIMLTFDPVFSEVTRYALLDLGQMVFILGYIISTFYWEKHYIGQGLLLGLAVASKFYSPVIIFLVIIYLYKFFNRRLFIMHELKVLVLAFIIFSLCYVKVWPFNIFFEQAKIIKFMLDHNSAAEWGGVIKMFFGGYILWPVLLVTCLFQLFKIHTRDVAFQFNVLPIIYIIIMSFQIPFTRYFILILPFLYLSFINTLLVDHMK